jgi:RimJ/RimL family protein N-acetyltransferase
VTLAIKDASRSSVRRMDSPVVLVREARAVAADNAEARFVEASLSPTIRPGGPSARRHACENPCMDRTPGSAPQINELGQPIGFALPGWQSPPHPPHETLTGKYCSVVPLRAERHAADLWEAMAEDVTGARLTYSFTGPYADRAELQHFLQGVEDSCDPQYYAIEVNGRALGHAAHLRIDPRHGVIEIGHIYYSPRLARTRAATEAMFLFMDRAFKLGYRRYEWKCDSCNQPSRAAATRYGFTYEGLFRQAIVYKGRNRDTSWFAIIDRDWHAGLRAAYQRWLDPANFDAAGKQRLKLSELTAPFVHARS